MKPTFGGGDANEFPIYVNQHMVYPESAKNEGAQGRIVVQFTVDTDGSMTDVKVFRGVHPDLDAEVVRVITSCPEKWTPGQQDGKPVKVTYLLPVVCKLK